MQIQEKNAKRKYLFHILEVFPENKHLQNIQILCTGKLVQLLSKNFHFKCNQNVDDTSIIIVNPTCT